MEGKIEKRAKEILKDFPQIKEQPASISGKFHIGETLEQHLERTASIMRHLCDGMNIRGEDRDIKKVLMDYKKGNYNMGDVIDEAEAWIGIAKEALENCNHEQNKEKINEFLLDIRRRYW